MSDDDEAAGLRVLREGRWAVVHVLALLAAVVCIGAGLVARWPWLTTLGGALISLAGVAAWAGRTSVIVPKGWSSMGSERAEAHRGAMARTMGALLVLVGAFVVWAAFALPLT